MDKSIRFGISSISVLSGITLVAGLALCVPDAKADDSLTDDVSFTIGVSCTMGVDENNSTAHTATINNSASESEIGKTRINVFCNDANGYTIYAVGSTNGWYGNNKLASGTALTNPFDINTGTTGTDNSRWAMKLTSGGGADSPTIISPYNDYALVPDDTVEVARRTSGTNVTASADKPYFDTTYQVYISSSQPAGTYTGQVKYVMVHPESSHSRTINDIVFMQDFATMTESERISVVASMIKEQQYQLKDKRDPINNGADYKTYYVSKLSDGRVWMTQNLDHDIRTDTYFYTHENTDLGYGDTIDIDAKWTAPSDVGAWSSSTTAPRYYDPGDKCWNGTPNNSTLVNCSQSGSHYHLGNYYNWTAAVALTSSSSYTTNAIVNQSICPAGWTLPKSESLNLVMSYGWVVSTRMLSDNKKIWESPIYLPLSGYLLQSTPINYAGKRGMFWHGISYPNNSAPYFYAFDTRLFPGTSSNGDRDIGNSVRCVLRE